MNNLATQNSAALIEEVLIKGDLSKLTETQRIEYYRSVCGSVGLNPLTRPFDYITLTGKLTLYAKRDATDQLRKIHKVSIELGEGRVVNDVYLISAKATLPDGRCDESTGAVSIKGLAGDALANAYLKCETKAKRRVTLSICGLGLLDETEVETIKDAKPMATPEPKQIVNYAPQSAQHQGASKAQALRDSMASNSQSTTSPVSPAPDVEPFTDADHTDNPGDVIIQVGKKYKGRTFNDVGRMEIEGYVNWLENETTQSGKPLSDSMRAFLGDAYRFLGQGEVV